MATQDNHTPQQLVDQWNRQHPVGTTVTLTNGVGVKTHTTTTSTAMAFAKREAVVFIKGMVGFVNLNRLTLFKEN